MVEEFLTGEEASFFAFIDGENCVPLVGAQVRLWGGAALTRGAMAKGSKGIGPAMASWRRARFRGRRWHSRCALRPGFGKNCPRPAPHSPRGWSTPALAAEHGCNALV